jgi:BlaI family transcriptional regulator, penicillinase repressor
MNRPAAEALTQRELEVMHLFWAEGELTAQAARDRLESTGRSLTYTTVATLCRILWEKGFLDRVGELRPFTFKPTKSFDEVSGHLVHEMIQRVFQGSREQLLVQIIGGQKLSAKKQALLEQLLVDDEGDSQ